jgi:hypothetical protein
VFVNQIQVFDLLFSTVQKLLIWFCWVKDKAVNLRYILM